MSFGFKDMTSYRIMLDTIQAGNEGSPLEQAGIICKGAGIVYFAGGSANYDEAPASPLTRPVRFYRTH